jgi:hypothetical protein
MGFGNTARCVTLRGAAAEHQRPTVLGGEPWRALSLRRLDADLLQIMIESGVTGQGGSFSLADSPLR